MTINTINSNQVSAVAEPKEKPEGVVVCAAAGSAFISKASSSNGVCLIRLLGFILWILIPFYLLFSQKKALTLQKG